MKHRFKRIAVIALASSLSLSLSADDLTTILEGADYEIAPLGDWDFSGANTFLIPADSVGPTEISLGSSYTWTGPHSFGHNVTFLDQLIAGQDAVITVNPGDELEIGGQNAGSTLSITTTELILNGAEVLTTGSGVTEAEADTRDAATQAAAVAEVQPALAAKANSFPLSWGGRENRIDTAGTKELSQITAIADDTGSLNGLYFQLGATPLSSAAIDYTASASELVDVWFNVDDGGTAPDTGDSGGDRQIEVAISEDDTAETVAGAIVSALNADVSFSAGRDGADVRIQHSIAGAQADISAGDSGMTVSALIDGSGELSGSNKWYGGVLAPNGKIYCVPRDSTSVLIIDPETDTAEQTSITGLSGSSKWIGGVLAPSGKIYCVPFNSTSVLIIDPETDTAEQT